MGKLKPIGSEKLGGMEKIQRILEISKYNLNTPQSINESESLEYSKTLADGNTYHITKEKNGYVIKKGLTESVSEYIEPMKNRKYYSSYSQALKRLNLIVKEVNVNEGYRGNLSLFNEEENIDDKKYFLVKGGETNEQEEETPIPPAPAQTAPVTPPAAPTAPETEIPVEEPLSDEEPMTDEMPIDDEVPMDDEGETPQDEDIVTFKSIQKLTGKLAQKLRTFGSEEENDMSSQDVKYVINSILSALDLSKLEPDDMEEIIGKFEETEEPEMKNEELPEPDMNVGELPEPEVPMTPEGEMAEMYPRHGRRESFEERQQKMKMREMGYGVSESKVDRILQKYFNETPKNINESKLERLSESFKQESTSKKFLNKYPAAKLIGKNKKGTLVFEMKGEKFGVTTSGKLI